MQICLLLLPTDRKIKNQAAQRLGSLQYKYSWHIASAMDRLHFFKSIFYDFTSEAYIAIEWNEINMSYLDVDALTHVCNGLLSCNSFRCNCNFCHSLFVFHSDDPQQNVISYLTSVFNTVFYALSHGTFLFSFHGS